MDECVFIDEIKKKIFKIYFFSLKILKMNIRVYKMTLLGI